MNLLVTGGAGYIGSIVADELLKAGHKVIVYDNLSRGYAQAIPTGAEFFRGDIADRNSLDIIFTRHRIDAVMHFAAFIEVGESMRAPELYFRNNTVNAVNLLEAMLAHGVDRLVFSSTAAVYGEPECVPIPETHPLRPTNVYGESKLLVERMLAWFNRIHGLRYASLRYFNAAGASGALGEAHQPESHLIPNVLRVALGERDRVHVYGSDYFTSDGTCVRDFIHVVDLATAHLLALDALSRRDQLIYNLGNGRGFSVKQVIEAARRVTGHPIATVDSARRLGDPATLVASSDKIRDELGWQPRYPELDAIVASAWQWHRAHPHGYAAAQTERCSS